MLIKLIALLLLLPSLSHADTKIMNGIRMEEYKDFDKKWKFITVRFRKDTGEIRITYANDKAYKTLIKGETNYPDGAVFAKIGYRTTSDTLFESSLVPSSKRRYQFMVHDKKKYKDHAGWGYALFTANGEKFSDEAEKDQVEACAACHYAAEERGHVFSWPINGQPVVSSSMSKINFKEVKRTTLIKKIQDLIPAKFETVNVIDHKIASSLFQGTFDEVKPLLATKAFKTKQPSVIMNPDQTRFSIVVPDMTKNNCMDDEGSNGISMHSMTTGLNDTRLINHHFCQTY